MTLVDKIKKQFIISSFICFSLIFPFFNSFEIIAWGTQKTFAVYCLILDVVLFCLFLMFSNFYDLCINLMFHNFSLKTLKIFRFFSEKSKEYPRITGFIISLCFLSILIRAEYPTSLWVNWLTSFIIVFRNLLVFPAIGYFSLARWCIKHIEQQISLNRISEAEAKKAMSGHDFETFNQNFTILVPFSSSNRSKNYNYTTKRNIIQWARTVLESTPTAQAVTKTVRTTVAMTVPGSAALTLYTTGHNVNSAVETNVSNTLKWSIVGNKGSTPETDAAAKHLIHEANVLATKWISTSGPNNTFRGLKYWANTGQVPSQLDRSEALALAASKLQHTIESPAFSAEQKSEIALKLIKSTSSLPSPLENLHFLGSFYVKFKSVFSCFF